MAEPANTPTDESSSGAAATSGEPVYQWAPAEPKKRKRHGGLWAGGIAVAAIVGLVAASLVLIAPGTAIAGVQVGGLTAGAAAEAVQSRLSQTDVVLTGAGGDAIVSGADLGAHVDAKSLADAAYAERPMWNPTAWFAGASDASVSLDPEKAAAALRAAAPSLYRDAVDAAVTFDTASKSYIATPAAEGTGIDVGAVTAALQSAFAEGRPNVDVAVAAVPVAAHTTTAVAQAGADMLNGMIAKAGFYVGAERTVPIAAETLASWLTVAADERGAIVVTADAAKIQTAVDALSGTVDRKVKAGTVIASDSGKVIKTLTKGVSGRVMGSTSGLGATFATQLAQGTGTLVLPVTETQPTIKKVSRSIEVDLSQQRMYLRQDGKVVGSYYVSTGKPGHATHTGTYRIVAKLATQNMGNPDLTKAPNYYTENVPWVMYFNGDQALHGAYWHHNFGHVMSHGCVNLPVSVAKMLYEWAPMGTTVWVHG